MLHELGWPIDLTNRVIQYTCFYGYLDELQAATLYRTWRRLKYAEDNYLANRELLYDEWMVLPVELRQRFWHNFTMYGLILLKIVGVQVVVDTDFICLRVIDDYDFIECLNIMEAKGISIEYISIDSIKISGMLFRILYY
jgi:hypothetical protein